MEVHTTKLLSSFFCFLFTNSNDYVVTTGKNNLVRLNWLVSQNFGSDGRLKKMSPFFIISKNNAFNIKFKLNILIRLEKHNY